MNEQKRSSDEICITPVLQALDQSSFRRFFKSHDWILENVEPYARHGITMRMQCSRYRLGRYTLLYDIEDSAKKKLDVAGVVKSPVIAQRPVNS